MTDIAEHRCTEAKHTPGPWSVGNGSQFYVSNGCSWVACAVGIRGEEGEANVRLIAAAPDLLALAHQYANDLRYPPTADSIPRRLAAIEAVLVKLEI